MHLPLPDPGLTRVESDGVSFWTDERLRAHAGVIVAFSERQGGVSAAPYDSLNLAAHVGDDLRSVDENRRRFLVALGLAGAADRLVTAEQVHGSNVAVLQAQDAGRGGFAAGSRQAVPKTDALLTAAPALPLLLLFADCVPVVLVAPGPVIAVAHAGWRGALAGLPGTTAQALAARAGCPASSIRAYVGAHIRACHYDVDETLLSQFANVFGTVSRAESGGLDLGAVVTSSLTRSGVDPCSIAALGTCTAESTERFFSYRAEGGLTGRHGALACIVT